MGFTQHTTNYVLAIGYCSPHYTISNDLTFNTDALLRSSLYAHFSESLAGLATIRAYGESERFKKENVERVDIENRCANFCSLI